MLWLCVSLFSPRAEVLVSIAKENTSILHLRGTNKNLSHASYFHSFCAFHLEWPQSYFKSMFCMCIVTAVMHTFSLYHIIVVVHDYIVFKYPQLPNVWNHHESIVCELLNPCVRVYICMLCNYLFVCEIQRDEAQQGMSSAWSTHTQTSLSHPLCLSLSLDPSPAVIRLILSPC